MTFAELVAAELKSARAEHGPIHSLHEGYGVLMEEVTEFEEEVFLKASKRDPANIRKELIQVAAMAQKVAEDLGFV